MPARFNHMELTLPVGRLQETREAIAKFYGDLFGWDAIDVPILGQLGLLLRTDPETSQFILVTEQKKFLESPGYDHLGLIYETRAEVDTLLARAKSMQAEEPAIQIKEYEDLVTGPQTTHAFYVKHLLPIWFDVQNHEHAEGTAPERAWSFG